MQEIFLTLNQALQLVALLPCLFIIVFLVLTAERTRSVVVPCLYFVALACSFILPLLALNADLDQELTLRAVLLLGESAQPALSFLLIVQLLIGRIPSSKYWLILAVPLVGGGLMAYATLLGAEACFAETICVDSVTVHTLYHVAGASLIFLLLMLHFFRTSHFFSRVGASGEHKYWVVISLITLSLLMLMLDLARLTETIDMQQYLLITTVVRIGFIYLVLTSLFRLFDRPVPLAMERLPTFAKPRVTDKDHPIIAAVEAALQQDRVYREMGLTREALAERLHIPEHQLSRVVNGHFKKNLNELLNHYRVEEAKERLLRESTAITVIAFEVGFNSIASFNRAFKELVGKAPSEFRAAAGK